MTCSRVLPSPEKTPKPGLSCRSGRGLAVFALAAAAFLAPASPSRCQTSIETQIEQLRTIYQKNTATIRKRHDDSLSEWPLSYVTDLKALQKRAQTAGDLESWISIQAELERFEKDRVIRSAHLVKEPAPLLELQQKYQDSDTKIEKVRSDDLGALKDKYLAALARLQAGLTRAGQIQDALKVNEEIKRTQGPPEPVAAGPEEPGDSGDDSGETESQPPASVLLRTQVGAFTVFAGGVPPPIPGIVLKPFPLMRSESLKTEPKAVMAAEAGVAPQSAGRSAAEYVPYRSREGVRIHYVRLSLKPTGGAALPGVTLFIQYYAKEASDEDAGRYTKVCEDITALPELPAQGMVVECPPVETQGPSAGPAGTPGQELHGVVATLFDGARGVIAQAASSSTLGRLASQNYPPNADEVAARRAYDEARELFYKARSERTSAPGDAAREAACEKAREAYYSAQKNYQSKRGGAR